MSQVKLYAEADFLHLPEDERPYKRPFPNHGIGKAAMIWMGGKKFYDEHGQKWAGSCSSEDLDGTLMIRAIEEGRRSAEPCNICHCPHYQKNYMNNERMLAKGICFHCDFFEQRVANPLPVIIDGNCYTPGNATTGQWRGMGGRRFDIEFIDGPHKGKKITTFDLWTGGKLPPYWASKLKDNAVFLGGAGAEELKSQIVSRAWNGSSEKTEPYPLPRTLGLR